MAKATEEKSNKSKELAYYLTVFKIEGHTTYRALLHSDTGGFAREWEHDGKHPAPLDKKIYRFDRITGEIKEQHAK